MDRLQDQLLKWGSRKSLLVLTSFSIVTSVLLAALFITPFWRDDPRFSEILTSAMLTAAAVSAVISPLIITVILKMFFKVHVLEQETRHLVTYDALTGLLSRRAFYELAERQMKIAIRNKQPLSVIVADLDGFKSVNDTYGHNAGDYVLKRVGQIIVENARETDLTGRMGGDEFVFCLPGASEKDAKEFGERLLKAFNQGDFNYNGVPIEFGISLGMHVQDVQRGQLLSDLIHKADVALYQAKSDGKGRLR